MSYVEYRSTSTIRVDIVDKDCRTPNALCQYPNVPNIEPNNLKAMFEFESMAEFQTFNKELGLMVATFVDSEEREISILVNRSQRESIESQYRTKCLYGASCHLSSSTPSSVKGIAKMIGANLADIGNNVIIYVDNQYTSQQMEFIEKIPLKYKK